MNEIISIKGLTKKYGEKIAVDNLDLIINKGEVFGLLGPNGAGKSTTILMILGLTEPTEGSVFVCGHNSTNEPLLVKGKVGYLPDQVGFYENRTGLENLMFTAALNGKSRKEAREKAISLLEQVGLSYAANQKAGTYSRGMKQRLGLADVLIKDPEVIILDEPTLGIDPKGVQELLDLIRTLSKEQGITVMLSSHQLHQVQQICDRVGLFVNGNLLAEGTVDSLASQLFGEEGHQIKLKATLLTPPIIDEIKLIDGVRRVELDCNELSIWSDKESSLQPILEIIMTKGCRISSISQEHVGLDEIYQRYFEGAGEK
ncbi:ABC transporter ATP-binding protein [Lederbergia wuyishanensis]|uniref:ABC-2 type transport system ATP-binding protein n=1 Tax=Lederbergia wuyishanensis TaxID=1347903 RepID=A0ABU0D845_9BACI|nr:ABC transporter ATP-binding protein [Lederbergia wuyishanensis]MCJ8009270.1 ABC transporter ATP-binding protein [Lederbergia wuyishanensis]MDQ0344596.1 ABC-2 type transport system ATP-binding protein [Lederbergia wuyishanensis]